MPAPEEPFELTARHERLLETIGPSGGTRTRLKHLAGGGELRELEHAGYVWHDSIAVPDPDTGSARMDIWYLTDLGASAVGIDPARLFRRP